MAREFDSAKSIPLVSALERNVTKTLCYLDVHLSLSREEFAAATFDHWNSVDKRKKKEKNRTKKKRRKIKKRQRKDGTKHGRETR